MDPILLDQRASLVDFQLARLVDESVARCALDLSDVRVLTEAATGPYSVTPVLAAVAGAEVVAVTRATRYGSVEQVLEQTRALAELFGVTDRITVTERREVAAFAEADAVTNSGHLRPIVGEHAAAIRSDAVLSLMFEVWEVQAGRLDLDLDGLLAKGVQMAGTNERHPHVNVFSYLGPMAVAQLADADVDVRGGSVGVLCDNPFREFLRDGLSAVGAHVRLAAGLDAVLDGPPLDALVVALRPTGDSVLDQAALHRLAAHSPHAVIAQFWGDVDRLACAIAGLRCWPEPAPAPGHMGVLPGRVGPEPIVRLQAGGLKVAQVLCTPPALRNVDDLAYLDPLSLNGAF